MPALRVLRPLIASACLAVSVHPAARAEQLIADTLIVSGSLCAGAACTAGESFANGTVKFRQNAVRIHFDDASTTPQTDWQIEINDGSQSGPSYFALNDLTAGTTPFAIDAGASDSSLHIGQSGRIGIGTVLPQGNLHLADSFVRLRVEETGWSTPNTWDFIANEGTLFLSNAGNGTIPLIARNSAESALMVFEGERVGVGTQLPEARLHVQADPGSLAYRTGLVVSALPATVGLNRFLLQVMAANGTGGIGVQELSPTTSPRTLLELKNNGRPEIVMANSDTGGEWSFGAGTNFILKQGAVGTTSNVKAKLFEIDPAGNATLTGTLVTGGTTCGGGCDAVFAPDYPLPSIADHAARMQALGYLPNVGPTPEGAPIDLTDKLGRMLNELEHAHLYIAQLEAARREDKARRDAQQAQFDGLRRQHADRLAALEARLAELAAD
ncbi:MAG: hypothetical protein R3D85_13355 [Paracoccaceae bacterium]